MHDAHKNTSKKGNTSLPDKATKVPMVANRKKRKNSGDNTKGSPAKKRKNATFDDIESKGDNMVYDRNIDLEVASDANNTHSYTLHSDSNKDDNLDCGDAHQEEETKKTALKRLAEANSTLGTLKEDRAIAQKEKNAFCSLKRSEV